jgi:hypothetical protein
MANLFGVKATIYENKIIAKRPTKNELYWKHVLRKSKYKFAHAIRRPSLVQRYYYY